jgi:hypothetical protein
MTIWVKRLKDPDSGRRLAALREIQVLGDPNLLPTLAEVFATDSDSAVRELAQKIGKEIYYNEHRKREAAPTTSSQEERRRAAEILEKANQKKQR